MSKVKLTKKQAVIIESLKEEHLEMLKELYEHPENYDIGKLEPLMDLTAEQYHEALYVGYEVEKEYKAGDFVVHKDGHTGLIDNVHTNNPQGEKVFEGAWFDGNDFMLMLTDENNFERRANEEEIAEFKMYEWWRNNDRDPWEFKPNDVVLCQDFNYGGIYIVESNNYGKDAFGNRLVRVYNKHVNNGKTLSFDAKELKVICFAEDRKDIK